ncbi:AGAP000990-PA-like protein [Anopheles sinensis]|uniref:AGAP000990-PA-like protein n=1 Tax=Anopheles sinensis TaxID=74873 RepID=A0A084VJF8_ANOSI|nr:AGAP000990-PA-like protein [Anopheles sinensis]
MANQKSNNVPDAKFDRSDGHRLTFECSEDEEVSMIFGFEENDARQKLNSFPKCSRLVISPDLQAELGMEIGSAVSVEHPWREIKKEVLEEHLPGKTKVQRQLKDRLRDLEPGRLVLMGYLADQSTEEENVFAVFTDQRETREARELIRRLELVERLWAAAAMRKKARRWQSHDSERDVENFIPKQRTNVVNVESQSIFPAQRAGSCRFRLRLVGDARDGYVALLPKGAFRNIVRKSIDFGVQLRPQKVHKFQQTDPTFPTNAWSQYLYEIGHEQRTASAATATATTQSGTGPAAPAQQDKQERAGAQASDHVVQLLDTLEFNQIDMYRNDYPIISRRKAIAKYETPHVGETMCFMERATCANRHVSAIEWHPTLAGSFVAAYVRHIPSVLAAGTESGRAEEDAVNRLVFEKCPVLAWNFDESLVPKLWFDSPREVTALSFCPYDERLLVGGLASGQLAIWELTNAQLEHAGPRAPERDTRAAGFQHHHPHQHHQSYRSEIKALLAGGTPEGPWHVRPVVISALERSARKPITVIRWLPPNYHCAPTGQLRVKGPEEKLGRVLLTGALDGSVCLWDLDQSVPVSQQDKDKGGTAGDGEGEPVGGAARERGEPGTQVTGMACLNNVLQPTFRVRCESPIVALAFDEPPPPGTGCRMAFVFGTLLGGLCWGKWDGYEFDQGATVNEEPVRELDPFAPVHDGPLVAIARNTFVPEVLLTAGGTVLALWTADCRQSPVFWRCKPAIVTACAWSLDRPSVFFVGLANGDFEIWDLQINTSTACVALNLGANVLSIITQQQQQQRGTVQRNLAVADGNCNVRLLSIPAAFGEPRPSERRRFRQLIRAELARKHEQQAWVQRYYEQNREQIEARLRAEQEARELAERLEVEKQEHDDFLRRQALEEAKKKALRDAEKRVDLSRRLECRWRSRYYRALIRTMMARRHLSPELLAKQMHPERERRRYDVRKRATIGESVAAAPDDYRRVQRALGLPGKAGSVHGDAHGGEDSAGGGQVRARLRETVRARFREELADYPRVSWEAKEVLRVFQLPLDLDNFASIVAKGRARRQLVLSDDHGNMEHLQAYLAKQAARGPGDRVNGLGPATGDDTESTVTNGSPDVPGTRATVGLQRARSVTFIDDVPDVGQKAATAVAGRGTEQQS